MRACVSGGNVEGSHRRPRRPVWPQNEWCIDGTDRAPNVFVFEISLTQVLKIWCSNVSHSCDGILPLFVCVLKGLKMTYLKHAIIMNLNVQLLKVV